ncbi:hypothetical protein A2U01_0030315, partial [Trifolium medium]|nr:hypothetical protein [Trifolium medium]
MGRYNADDIANAEERMMGDFNETDDDEYDPSHHLINQPTNKLWTKLRILSNSWFK